MGMFANTLQRKADYLAVTPEFLRIKNIPRRVWSDDEIARLVKELTARLRTRDGTRTLKPAQALALHDIIEQGGLFGPMRVGSGKTLVSLLAAYVLQGKNPLLLMPSGLITKTLRELKEDYAPHWKIPRNIEMFGYEPLARAANAKKLTQKRPDPLICDEAHKLKNLDAGCTKRVERLMREYPETRLIVLGGSLQTHGIRDFGHLTKWSLKDSSPVPHVQGELEEWADALDEKVPPFRRLEPGPLLSLATEEDRDPDGNDTVTARRAFRRRMVETQGIVCTSGTSVDASLYIREYPLGCNKETEKLYQELRGEWKRPDGWVHEEAMQVWKTARELALGFAYVWTPHPPDEWLQARRDWAKFVRTILERSRTLDTPGQVKIEVEEGRLADGGKLAAWLKIEPTFTPNLRAQWHDDTALNTCLDWMANNEGIVWCEHTWFAEELSRRSKRPYFGREGLDKNKNYIESASGTIIASIAANSVGRNLQKWNKSLITSPPTTSTGNEQLIGRTHRDGQMADEVTIDILCGCFEHYTAVAGAHAEAKAEADTLPGSDQAKLLIGNLTWPTTLDVNKRLGYRWMATRDVVAERAVIDLRDL